MTISTEDGNRYVIEKNFTELLDLTNSIIEKNPTDFNAFFYKGRSLLGLEKYSEAVTTFETILKEHDVVTNHVLFYYAVSLSKIEEYELAIRYFDYITEDDGFYYDALLEKGIALNMMGNFTQALTTFNEILTLNPESTQGQINKANTLSKMNKHEEALSIIDQILTKHPDNVYAIINKGIILKNEQKLVRALEVLDEALKLDKTNLIALNEKALILSDLERYDEALAIYDVLIQDHPTDTKLLNNKGVVLVKAGRDDDAFDLFNKVLEYDPKDASALVNRGAYHQKKLNYEKAIEEFNAALEIEPKNLAALKNKYLALGKLERHKEVLEVIRTILTIQPDDEQAIRDRDVAIQFVNNEQNSRLQIAAVVGIIISIVVATLFVVKAVRKEKTKDKFSKKTYIIIAFPIWLIITVLIVIYLDLHPYLTVTDEDGDVSNWATLTLGMGFSMSLALAIFLYSKIEQEQLSHVVVSIEGMQRDQQLFIECQKESENLNYKTRLIDELIRLLVLIDANASLCRKSNRTDGVHLWTLNSTDEISFQKNTTRIENILKRLDWVNMFISISDVKGTVDEILSHYNDIIVSTHTDSIKTFNYHELHKTNAVRLQNLLQHKFFQEKNNDQVNKLLQEINDQLIKITSQTQN